MYNFNRISLLVIIPWYVTNMWIDSKHTRAPLFPFLRRECINLEPAQVHFLSRNYQSYQTLYSSQSFSSSSPSHWYTRKRGRGIVQLATYATDPWLSPPGAARNLIGEIMPWRISGYTREESVEGRGNMIWKEGRNWRRCCRNRIFVLIRITSFPGRRNRVEITFGNWIKIVGDFLNLQRV